MAACTKALHRRTERTFEMFKAFVLYDNNIIIISRVCKIDISKIDISYINNQTGVLTVYRRQTRRYSYIESTTAVLYLKRLKNKYQTLQRQT